MNVRPTAVFHELNKEFAPTPGHVFGPFEAGVLLVACIGLTLMQFGGSEDVFLQWVWPFLSDAPSASWRASAHLAEGQEYYHLAALAHWSLFCLIGYVVVPWLYLKRCGWSWKDTFGGLGRITDHGRIYLGLYLLVLIPVIAVSFTPEYQKIYPFYPQAGRSILDLIAWQLIYGLQFISLEFFFRGFLLATLRPCFGFGAVFVSVIPYCMLHFPKTSSESLAAIFAGVFLGILALRYRSVWGGALLHWAVAFSMDVASLIQQGNFPSGI